MNEGNPHHYAVVVGITKYPGEFPQLAGPANDVEAFYEWLTDPRLGGVPVRNIRKVITPTNMRRMTVTTASPTKTTVDKALWEVTKLARKALADLPEEEQARARCRMRLYLYVAGHGIMPSAGETALLTAKAQAGWLENVELRAYNDWYVRDGTFGEVCIFADCCRTYQQWAAPGVPPFDLPAALGGSVFSLIGYATAPGKLAFEDDDEAIPPDNRRGYFSRALIDGLHGSAMDPSLGYVTSLTLAQYVSDRVPVLSNRLPQYLSQIVRMPVDPHLLRFGPEPARAGIGSAVSKTTPCQLGSSFVAMAMPSQSGPGYQVVVRFPEHFADSAELAMPDGRRLSWEPTEGPWTVRLDEGLYVVFRAGTDLDATGLANGGAFEVRGGDLNVQL
jgi:Caspase domain